MTPATTDPSYVGRVLDEATRRVSGIPPELRELAAAEEWVASRLA